MSFRPLDRVGSIKVKFSIVIVAAVAIAALMSIIGIRVGIPVYLRPPIAAIVALLLVYPFSRGLTAPLRAGCRNGSDDERDFERPVTATSRDEVGELARSFNAMRAQLADVDRQRRDLVANVSHELRTPLASLRARFENIADGVDIVDEENLRVTLAEVDRLARLVDQLLDLSRLESRGSPAHLNDFDLAEAARLVADTANATASAKEVKVLVEVPDELAVEADELRITQLMTNLVDNAVRHAPRGSDVVLDAAVSGETLRITVSDAGPGIPDQERARVFERFYRVDQGRSTDHGGSGLGLAIARGIVELHGGSICIESNSPSGCRFVVELPTGAEARP